jgi:hypothetical protein
MSLRLPELLSAIQEALRRDVMDELKTEHARSQVLATVDILEKLKALADWSPAVLEAQIAALDEGLRSLRVEAQGLPDHPAPRPSRRPATSADLEEIRAASLMEIDAWTEWFYGCRDGLEPARAVRLETLLRTVIRDYLAVERSRISAADYSSMT